MKKHILLLAATLPLAVAGFAHPSFAEEQKAIDFTPKRPMTIERHDYQDEAIKAQQAEDLRNAGKRNQTETQTLHQVLLRNELGGQSVPNQLPQGNVTAPTQPDAGKAAAKPAN